MAQETLTRLTATPDAVLPPRKMSFEEFMAWADEDTHAEWVDGEVSFMSPLSTDHQEIGRFLLRALSEWVEFHELGAIRYEGFLMKLETRPSGREPDILFVANENRGRLRNTYLDGPADLAVEIVSPESVERDRVDKFQESQAGGVREYWLIDPQQRRAEWYQRGEDGLYHSVATEDGVCHSAVLNGLWLREAWLWQLPKLRDVLREWKLI
jgi:Uma2 family endonuclease